MGSAKHTPGPWQLRGYTIFERGKTALSIATVTKHEPNAEANGLLMAASPDLAYVLANLLAQWEAFEASSGNQEDAYYKLAKYARPLWEAAREAIAKAEGRP